MKSNGIRGYLCFAAVRKMDRTVSRKFAVSRSVCSSAQRIAYSICSSTNKCLVAKLQGATSRVWLVKNGPHTMQKIKRLSSPIKFLLENKTKFIIFSNLKYKWLLPARGSARFSKCLLSNPARGVLCYKRASEVHHLNLRKKICNHQSSRKLESSSSSGT